MQNPPADAGKIANLVQETREDEQTLYIDDGHNKEWRDRARVEAQEDPEFRASPRQSNVPEEDAEDMNTLPIKKTSKDNSHY